MEWLLYFLRLSFCILMKLLLYLDSSDINGWKEIMSLKRVLLFSLCILVLSGLVGCRETEITVKSGLCAQIRASSLAGGMPVW